MKTFLLASLFIFQSTSLFAAEYPGVHERLFNILKVIHEQYVSPVSCDSATDLCSMDIDSMQCLRNSSCFVVFQNDDGSSKKVDLPKRNGLNLSLYIKMRGASASQVVDINRFGPRYRPHFRLETPMTCSHNFVSNEYRCQ